MVAQVFLVCVTIVILGWLWFFIVRPILEDYGVIRPVESVKNFQPPLMSIEPQNQPGSAGSGTGSAEPVPPQQHQAAPSPVPDFDAVLAYLTRHKLNDEQAIDLLTVAQRESGYLLSANKIREVVGGNEATVKARVARGRPRPPEPRASASLKRPQEGW